MVYVSKYATQQTQLMSTNELTEVSSLLVVMSRYSIAPLRKKKPALIKTKTRDKRHKLTGITSQDSAVCIYTDTHHYSFFN